VCNASMNETEVEDGGVVGPTQQQSCNPQPCIPCDSSATIVAGSSQTTLSELSLKTAAKSAYFEFNGTDFISVSCYASSNLPVADASGNIPWTYTVVFTEAMGNFVLKIPLTSVGKSSCFESLYFVVKAVTPSGGVGYAQGMYTIGSFGSIIECVNFCAFNDTGMLDKEAFVQFGNGEVSALVAGTNVVGTSSNTLNPFTVLKVLYIVLPLAAFVIAVGISAIVLRKKFSQTRTAESSEEEGNVGKKDDDDDGKTTESAGKDKSVKEGEKASEGQKSEERQN